jgi:hypothetical protein
MDISIAARMNSMESLIRDIPIRITNQIKVHMAEVHTTIETLTNENKDLKKGWRW